MAGMKMENLGEYAFLGGIVVAIIIGVLVLVIGLKIFWPVSA
jgi:Tfp pilus assembly protein PilO